MAQLLLTMVFALVQVLLGEHNRLVVDLNVVHPAVDVL